MYDDADGITVKTKLDNLQTNKQDLLVSGTNIKTINNSSILGNGNIEILGEKGDDGLDAYQPFKGWFDSSFALSTAYPSPQVGDFAYVKGATSTDPVAIYACATAGTWADSGSTFNPANNQEFGSGEALNVTNIVDGLTSTNAHDILSAKQGNVLDQKVAALGLKIEQMNIDLNLKNVTSSAAGTTPFIFKAGSKYHVKNNGSATVTISHRNTQDGISEDLVTIAASKDVIYEPTTDGLYLRYGGACNLDIYKIDGLYDIAAQTKAISETIESNKLHSAVDKYNVKPDNFVAGHYWYNNNGIATHITNSSTAAAVPNALEVTQGDRVVFSIQSSALIGFLVLADDEDAVIKTYDNTNIGSLNGELIIPQGCTKLYCNTAISNIASSFVIVTGALFENLQSKINTLNAFRDNFFVTPSLEVQVGKGVNAANGTISDVSGQKAIMIDLTQTKAVRIRFVLTVSSTYGYGFIVNGQWQGKRYSAFPSGLNYQQFTLDVPEGATEFRFSWSSSLYAQDNPVYCILEDALLDAYNMIGKVNKLENEIDGIYKENTINISDSIADGGILLDGTYDTNTTFGHVEIPLNGEIKYKSFTFSKTYVNNASRCCYGFVVNGQWTGYPGLTNPANTEEVTVDVPTGATKFLVSWNRNVISDANYVLKTHSIGGNSSVSAESKPSFQFMPDFVLSRVPQYQCPTKATILALTPSQLYTMYDGLVTSYPNYITKIDCDAAAQEALEITAPQYMDGLPIYMYKFSPKIGGNGAGTDKTSRFKILVTSMHPQEKFGMYSMFFMAKMICENWKNDVNAEQLRSLVDIYFLPCPWPWNMANGSRTNYNGVNGNRQFPTKKWVENGSGSDWSGTEPLSEYEAKVINYFLLQIQPNVSVDVHTSGNDNVGHMGIFLVNQNDQPLVDLCGVIARTTSNRAIQDNPNFPQDGDTCMYGVYPEDARAKGEFYEYAYEQGCKYSILSEESPYSKWSNGTYNDAGSIVEEYTDGILKEQIQYLFNTILRLVYAASREYYNE